MNRNTQVIEFLANLQTDSAVITSVRAEVIIPILPKKRLEIALYPNLSQIDEMRGHVGFEFSIAGILSGPSGQNIGTVTANRVTASLIHFHTKLPTVCIPDDLTIIEHDDGKRHPTRRISGQVEVTACELLQPSIIVNDAGKPQVVRQYKFQPNKSLSLSFDQNPNIEYDSEANVFPSLICSFNAEASSFDKDRVLESIDDVLLLASFAARKRSIATTFLYNHRGALRTTEYFGTRSTPGDHLQSFRGPLIELSNFHEYMANAFRALISHQDREQIRRIMNFTLPASGSTVEADFVLLYAALEMLVTRYRKITGLDLVLPKNKFIKLRKDISNFIDGIDITPFLDKPIGTEFVKEAIEAEKKGLLKDKIGELNRISFGKAFTAMLDEYGVSIEDLWPLIDGKASLSDIRNRLVHGDYFGPNHRVGLIYAREHLRWTIERILLSFLKVPIKISNASPKAVRFLNPYKAWHNEIRHFG